MSVATGATWEGLCAEAASGDDLKARIRQATEKALVRRNRFGEKTASQLTDALVDARKDVAGAILGLKSLGNLPGNKIIQLKGLQQLREELGAILGQLRRTQNLTLRKGIKESFSLGIQDGIGEFVEARLPQYQSLTPDGIEKLARHAFTLVDLGALDFQSHYALQLAGSAHQELGDGIQRTLLSGIATGKSAQDIVRDMGEVVKDRESFRHAGTRTFSKAQYRMEMIARTEVLRAHNMGRQKFHDRVGVRRIQWLTMGDERVCPVCGPLDGKVFPLDRFPRQPIHSQCRCSSMAAWPLVICGGTLGSKGDDLSDACLLPPQAIEAQSVALAQEHKKISGAFESGGAADLTTLTLKQLQTLAKQKGVALARTKSDFLALLGKAEPGIPHGDLGGQALQAKLKQHGIGALRTKDELVALLAQKQAAFHEAKVTAQTLKQVPPPGGLQGLSLTDLKEMAVQKGISLNMNKQDVTQLLDVLEPGVNHQNLSGQALKEAKKKFHIGPLKNKTQLIAALEKVAGQELAEQAKQQAFEAAQKETVEKAKATLSAAMEKVVVPASPTGYQDFLTAVKDAEAAIAGGGVLPQKLLETTAQEVALKKKLFQDQMGNLSLSALKDTAKTTKLQHWQWANKTELLTLFTETNPAKVEAALASIEKKHGAWALKHGGKKKPATAKTPVTPQPQSSPPPSPAPPPVIQAPTPAAPVFVKKATAFQSFDEVWENDLGKPGNFTHLGRADVGGAHTKEFWRDRDGRKWLFKPTEKKGDEFIAHGEEAAYKIARLLNPDAVQVRTLTLNGRFGSIQPWRENLLADFDFRDIAPEAMTQGEISQLQREHVLDWLIANHDAHGKQFLRGRDGSIVGIDKGQLFKYLGADRLSTDYHPNQKHGEKEPLYNTLFRAVRDGKVTVDPTETLRAIREVEKIGDEDYLSLIQPYADGRFKEDEVGKRRFLQLALDRKQHLRRDFETFFADVLKQRGFRFEVVDAVAAPKTTPGLGTLEKSVLQDASRLGWQGKVLPLDEGDIEDQNALVWVEKVRETGRKEHTRTVMKMKLRPEAQGKLLKNIQPFAVSEALRIGAPLGEDVFFQDILAGVKTVSGHAKDQKYNQATLDRMKAHLPALEKLAKTQDPEVKAMAGEYLDWIHRALEAREKQVAVPGDFAQYLRRSAPPPPRQPAGFTVRKTQVRLAQRVLEKGETVVTRESVTNGDIFGGSRLTGGQQYEVTFGDGTRVIYRPWNRDNPYAQQGELEVILPGGGSPDAMEKTLANLRTLGIRAEAASPQDAEIMYLQKQAYLSKVDATPDYQSLVKGLDSRQASKEERVRELRAFWEKRLGVEDLTQQPGYAPLGEYQLGFLDAKAAAGYRHQYRFDLSDEQMEKDMKGYALYHKLTNGEDLTAFVDRVLENNGAMVSTVEKLRMGLEPGGMSPERDMETGGASYVFTRLKKSPLANTRAAEGLYFKKRLLRRMDAISYNHDAFGRVTDTYVRDKRGSTPEQWREYSRNTSNETIFKNSVTLLDNLEALVVGSEREKTRLLDVFQKHGIHVMPDGRKVDQVVRVKK